MAPRRLPAAAAGPCPGLDDPHDPGPRPVRRRRCFTSGTRAAAGGAKATRNSSSTARNSPPPSAPAPKISSAMPGRAARRSSGPPRSARQRKQPRPRQRRPLAYRRERAVPAVVRGLHREVFPQQPADALRRRRLLVPGPRRHRSLRRLPADQRVGYFVRPKPFQEKDVLEAEALPIVSKPGNSASRRPWGAIPGESGATAASFFGVAARRAASWCSGSRWPRPAAITCRPASRRPLTTGSSK